MTTLPKMHRLAGLAGLVVVFACCYSFGYATNASALSGSPLKIAKFTIEAVEATREIPVEVKGRAGVEFVNIPYSPAYTQAGGHPWGLTVSGEFQSEETAPGAFVATRNPKDIVVSIPPGMVGNPQSMPRCPLSEVSSATDPTQCPPATQVGVARLDLGDGDSDLWPIVNVEPEFGQSAEFAIENTEKIYTPLITAHLIRAKETVSGGGQRELYDLETVSNQIPLIGVRAFEVTFWGVPADPSHNSLRDRFCRASGVEEPLLCDPPEQETGGFKEAGVPEVPFLSMPTDCTAGPEKATMRADSWEEPGTVEPDGQYSEQYAEASATMPGVTGCGLLKFEPTLEAQPDTLLADEPVGLGVNIKVPQPEQPGINATPHLRDATVTLPEGMSISPGSVDGIQACELSGGEGINFTGPESEEKGPDGEWQLAPGHCPDASTVGTAEAVTPLLGVPVKGHVYLARPGCGGVGQAPCTEQDALDGNLYKLYLELGGTGEFANVGIQIKVPGYVSANPATGQLTTRFVENPQLPFSELKVRLNGGPRAPLANPATCGPAVTTVDFTPWSAPGVTPENLLMGGTPDATPSSFFDVSGCTAPKPFNPGFMAGTVTGQAGQYSPFTMVLSRQDREQFIKGIQVHTPQGLLAKLASVPLCPETQANDPTLYGECTASKIGTTRVASGAGSHPFEIEGNVYLTGPHDGAPFGLSIVTHAMAGPFNLGLVEVRARIDVDPTDSTATITTDESGPYAVPQIIFGVPLRLQRITVDIDRPGFMFNPTSCAPLKITANVSGSEQAVAHVSSPMGLVGCKSLAFKPKFTVSTNAHTGRKQGASLDAKLSYPKGALGSYANIKYVKVSLPKQLPSRLSTLQKACPAAKFERNPEECPKGSIVGVARTTTPVLPVKLSGPVYFVSHGGEAFPSLIVVLQGDGVRVDLTGTTFISKASVTSSTFKAVPDVPVESFELYLPQGSDSALAANGNLCKEKSKLLMPTEFVAQNGVAMKQSTKISVVGCPKVESNKRARRASQDRKGTGR